MKFGLNDINGTSNSQPKLKAWEIHDVVLKSIEFSEFKGKKDPNATFQTMKVRFENEDGYYEEQIWCPKEGDDVRQTSTFGENTRENPSNLERFQFFLAHMGEQLVAPERYAKFKGLTWDLPKDFPKLVETFKKVMEPAIGKSTRLKLIGTKKGEACLPYFVNISKEGKSYISNNFLGDKVFFSPYELQTMEKYKNAKPTDMSKQATDEFSVDESDNTENNDLNFEL